MKLIFEFLISLGSAWGVTKLLILANASVGLSDYLFFPWVCDFINSFGVECRTVVFWLLFIIFLVTGLPLKITRSIMPIVGFIIIAIIALIALWAIWGIISLAINSL